MPDPSSLLGAVRLVAGYTPHLGVILLLALVSGIVIWDAIAGLRDRSTPGATGLRVGLLALRIAALAALAALVFELGLRIEGATTRGRRVVVLVDDSASMALPDAPEAGADPTSRIDRARRLWLDSADARQAWQASGLTIEVRGFAEELEPWSGDRAERFEPEPMGAASRLAAALERLHDEPGTEPLAAVVVLSDGLVAAGPGEREHVLEAAAGLGVPVTTAAMGAPAIRDVAVSNLRVGEFAFVENLTELEADLVAHGLAGELATVSLLRDGKVVDTTRVNLSADGVARPVRFETIPDRTGQFVYEIRVEPLRDEATLLNNRRAFVVKVLRDKVRILHVAGRPDWDVRALRTLLRRDPNVELLSYYILRDAADIERDDASAPMSLIAFPVDELFRKELDSFDLLILHNYDATLHGDYLGNIARYVTEGGSLVIIGGDMGLGTGEYAQLDGLLPIEPRRPAALEREPFTPRLTEAGGRHPITAWLGIEEGDAALEGSTWSGLPPLDTFNPTGPARGGVEIAATTLLEHPDRTTGAGRPLPLLSVAEPGKGRTMVLSTGSTWRLGFAPELALVEGSRPYDLLWLGAIRWLLREAGGERLVLETDRADYTPAIGPELRVRTLTPSYAPEAGVEVEWELRRLGDASGKPTRSGRWTTDGLGRASQRIEPLAAGEYEAIARRGGDGTDAQLEESRRVFRVSLESRELEEVDADPGTLLLAELAEATGGQALTALTAGPLPRELPTGLPPEAATRAMVANRRDVPLWSGWAVLLFLMLTLPGEWLLRRRHGRA